MTRIDEIRALYDEGRPIRRIDIKWLLEEIDRLHQAYAKCTDCEIVCLRKEYERVLAERDAAVEKTICTDCIRKGTVGCHCARAPRNGPRK